MKKKIAEIDWLISSKISHRMHAPDVFFFFCFLFSYESCYGDVDVWYGFRTGTHFPCRSSIFVFHFWCWKSMPRFYWKLQTTLKMLNIVNSIILLHWNWYECFNNHFINAKIFIDEILLIWIKKTSHRKRNVDYFIYEKMSQDSYQFFANFHVWTFILKQKLELISAIASIVIIALKEFISLSFSIFDTNSHSQLA